MLVRNLTGSTTWRMGSAGMTLIELLVVVSLVSLFALLATPPIVGMLASSRVQSAALELKTSFDLARSEAIRQGTNATACPSTDGLGCSSTATNWSVGWLIWNDRNGNSALDPGEIVQVQRALASSLSLTGPSAPGKVVFSASDTPLSQVSFLASHDGSTTTRNVCVTGAGATSIVDSTCPP